MTANSSGGKEAELRYRAFGETRYTDGDTPTERRFTGQIEDGTIGLYFYNARYYDASLGRFVQADTIVPNPADPQSLNRYSYVLNNPLKYTDPSGHCIDGISTWICIAVGGAVVGAGASYVGKVWDNWHNKDMPIGEALTTDIDAGKIIGNAAGGAIFATTFYVAGPVVGTGFWETAAIGGTASVSARQASAVVEAGANEIINALQSGGEPDAARVWENAFELGFLNPEKIAIDGISGAVAAGVAYPLAKVVSSALESAGLIQSASETPYLVLSYTPALDKPYQLIGEGVRVSIGPDEMQSILAAIFSRLPDFAFKQSFSRIGLMLIDSFDED